MANLNIPTRSDLPAYFYQTELEGTLYGFEFLFNLRAQKWMMNIRDSEGNDVLMGLPLMNNWPMTDRFVKEIGIPPGEFVCIDLVQKITDPGRNDLNKSVFVVYAES